MDNRHKMILLENVEPLKFYIIFLYVFKKNSSDGRIHEN